jgi:flagellar protein FlaG
MDIRSIGSSPTQGQAAPSNVGSVASSSSQVELGSAQTKAKPTNEEVRNAVKEINFALQASSQNLEFSIDSDAKEVVVKVVDQQTRQVLRQIPTQEALDISKSLDKLQGLLINQQA